MTNDEEENAVRQICELIGYGRTMQLAGNIWAKRDKFGEMGAFVTGPCRVMVVPCPHPEDGRDKNGHCDWCCGAGWVTKKVLAAMTVPNGER